MRYAQVDKSGYALVFLEGEKSDWPDLEKENVLVEAPDNVEQGWKWDGNYWTPPAPPPPSAISPLEFRRRFSLQERSVITLAASQLLEAGNATLQVWLDDLNSAQEVHLDHPDLIAGINLLVQNNLLSSSRASEILS